MKHITYMKDGKKEENNPHLLRWYNTNNYTVGELLQICKKFEEMDNDGTVYYLADGCGYEY